MVILSKVAFVFWGISFSLCKNDVPLNLSNFIRHTLRYHLQIFAWRLSDKAFSLSVLVLTSRFCALSISSVAFAEQKVSHSVVLFLPLSPSLPLFCLLYSLFFFPPPLATTKLLELQGQCQYCVCVSA